MVYNIVILKHCFSISYLHRLLMTHQTARSENVFPLPSYEAMTYDQGSSAPNENHNKFMLTRKEIMNVYMSLSLFQCAMGY